MRRARGGATREERTTRWFARATESMESFESFEAMAAAVERIVGGHKMVDEIFKIKKQRTP
jgi:hypothetical protein